MEPDPSPESGEGPAPGPTLSYEQRATTERAVSASTLARGTAVHRYIILDRVGEGGMGVVYSAYDPSLDRRVALKFLSRQGAERHDVHERRLLREAQAMARLSHPNVAIVYEVGTFEGRLFLAMEFVDGVDLRAWLSDSTRSFVEILDVFRAAGRGLAAAHAAGIIHRDFKPENVLLDQHGRARVTDFGLSRASQDAKDTSPESIASSDETADGDGTADGDETALSSSPLTRPGGLLGTFSYMAPEQRRGRPADALSDQYSFCVALFEALHGERPFKDPVAESGNATTASSPTTTPGRPAVPRWCRRALLRGLSESPEHRFPSMEALLVALSPHPMSRRRQFTIAASLSVLATVAVAYGLFSDRAEAQAAPRCDLGAQRLGGVWDGSRKSHLREAFVRSGARGAEMTWRSFVEILDHRAGAWAGMHNEACAATHVLGAQSPTVLDLRMECLDRRRLEMKALVDVYAEKPDAKSLDRAVSAAENLSTISACADVANLRAVAPLPEDPAVRARISSIRQRLSRSLALYEAGRYEQGREYMESLKKEADAVGYGPLVGEAAHALARHLSLVAPAEAETVLFSAASQAVRVHDWELEAQILLTMLANYGRAGRIPESLMTARFAHLAVERANGDDVLRARLAMNTGSAVGNAGNQDESLRQLRLAEQLWRRALGGRSPRFAKALANTGNTLVNRGLTRMAMESLERALAIQRDILRPDHPDLAYSLDSLGQAYMNLGLLKKARETVMSALAIRTQELGPDAALTTYSVEQTANAEARLGNYKRAFELYGNLLATQRRVLDPRDVFLANTYLSLGDAQRRAGLVDEAERTLRTAIEHCARSGVPEYDTVGHALASLGQLHNRRGQHGEARRECQDAIRILSGTAGEHSSYLLPARECLAEALIAAGDFAAARKQLEQALPADIDLDAGPQSTAGARLQLARALWATPHERARALEVARAARDSLITAEGDNRLIAARIETWLDSHQDQPRH
jgi:eukaryotic-like serine/threonine-protein kinase